MIRTAIAMAAFALASCANTSGLEAKTTSSGFDGARVVDIQPHGAACTGMVCPGLGAQWSSKAPDSAIVTVAVFHEIRGITGAEVSVAGQATRLKAMGVITTFSRPGDPLRVSRTDFAAPLALVRSMASAERVWLRVHTTDGYIEAAIVDGQLDSKAVHALRRFISQVDAAK